MINRKNCNLEIKPWSFDLETVLKFFKFYYLLDRNKKKNLLSNQNAFELIKMIIIKIYKAFHS